MNTLRTSAALLASVACFAGFSALVGCSSADPATTSAPAATASPTPDKSVVAQGPQVCTSFESCPNIPCFCSGVVVNARGCNDGRCLDTLATCTEACKGTPQATGTGTSVPDPNGTVGDTTDPANTVAASGDPCVPVSVSAIARRVTPVYDLIVSHLTIPATPAGGSVYVARNQAGAISRISYDSPNATGDYVDTFGYDRQGRLASWAHDGAGVVDVHETFDYGLLGHITSFSRNVEGAGGDVTERFLYSLKGRLIQWTRNGDGFGGDVIENFSYQNGLITYFDHNGDGLGKDVTERFSYDASGRITDWTTNGDRTVDDASLSVSYNSTLQIIRTDGARAAGATVSICHK